MPLTHFQRRRTQVRNAQRAYRERKESNLEMLQAKVAHLEATINRIEKVVDTRGDDTVEGYTLDAKASFNQIKRLCDDCPRDKINNSKRAGPDVVAVLSARSYPYPQRKEQRRLLDISNAEIRDPAILHTTSLPFGLINDSSEVSYDVAAEYRHSGNSTLMLTRPLKQPSDLHSMPKDPENSLAWTIIRTCSFWGSKSVSARVSRKHTLLTCTRMLTEPSVTNRSFDDVFGLATQLGYDRETLLRNFQTVLDLSTSESSQFSSSKIPFNLDLITPKGRQVAIAAGKRPQLEGEWMDPYDVQRYLVRRGLVVDSTSQVVTVRIDSKSDKNLWLYAHGMNSVSENQKIYDQTPATTLRFNVVNLIQGKSISAIPPSFAA